ncbi:MAG: hypothetical protein JWQ56_3542 [Pseudarthrobacter sp.]|nr:hypothetical protein [Pseudarthrobacter sp.]
MSSFTYKALAVGAVTAAAIVVSPAAFAADSDVAVSVTGGLRTASFADASLTPVATSHSATTSNGSLVLTADDSTGTGAGWTVTASVSDFAYSGVHSGGTDISAANFTIAPSTVSSVAGQDTTGLTVGAGGSLDTPRTVLSADVNSGMGTYSQAVSAALNVPADSFVGTYTGTLTTNMTAGPVVE